MSDSPKVPEPKPAPPPIRVDPDIVVIQTKASQPPKEHRDQADGR